MVILAGMNSIEFFCHLYKSRVGYTNVFRVYKSSKEVTVGSVACTCRTVVIDQTLAGNGYGATLCTMTSVFFSKFLK
jgi:hypothetical protein